MHLYTFLLYVLTGVFSGLSAGFFGIGGGIINVPALMGIFHLFGIGKDPVRSSVATSLFIIVFTSLSATFTHFKSNKNLKLRNVFALGAGGSIGAILGALISMGVPGTLLRRLLGIFEFAVSIYFWLGIEKIARGRSISPSIAVAGGFVAGLISGMLGVGGGVFLVPFLTLTTSERHENIIAYSSVMITFSSIFGVSTFLFKGLTEGLNYVNFLAGICVAVASMISARIGVKTLYRIETGVAKKLYSVFLFFIGLRLII